MEPGQDDDGSPDCGKKRPIDWANIEINLSELAERLIPSQGLDRETVERVIRNGDRHEPKASRCRIEAIVDGKRLVVECHLSTDMKQCTVVCAFLGKIDG